MFLLLLFLYTHHHSHPPTKRKYNHPVHSPLLTCANTNTSHLSICGRDGCAPPLIYPPTCTNTLSHPLPEPLTVRVRPSPPTSRVRFPLVLCPRPSPLAPAPVPRFALPVASTCVPEPLCAHARDTRRLRSPPRSLPSPYPADRTMFDLPHLTRANKSRYTVGLTDTALGPRLVPSSEQVAERGPAPAGVGPGIVFPGPSLRTTQRVLQRETSAFGCLACSGRPRLGSCRVCPARTA